MKNKKVKKLINLILICLCVLMIFSTKSQANNANSWIIQGKNFIKTGAGEKPVIDNSKVAEAIIPVAQALVAIATVVLVVVTVVMGIKYMICESAEKKAKLKTQLIGLVVSTIVVFGAQVIWSVLYNFMKNITD